MALSRCAERNWIPSKWFQNGDDGGGLEKSACDPVGGALSATATILIDVLVATIQDASKAGQRVSVIDTWKERIAQGGVKSLIEYSTRGYAFRVAHVAMMTMLMKQVSSQVYNYVRRH